MSLVLSLFPGIGLLDRAFEEEGFCIVRGPDLLWGGDIRRFHPPSGVFDGVIGGPPCQAFSGIANFAHRWKHQPENLIPEFERAVREAGPAWFLMENVPGSPIPNVGGYEVNWVLVNNRDFGAEQSRERRFSYGTPDGMRLDSAVGEAILAAPINGSYTRTVTTHHGGRWPNGTEGEGVVSVEEALVRQGLEDDFFGDRSPFKRDAQKKMIAQGVPLPMGRAIAQAVKQAIQESSA